MLRDEKAKVLKGIRQLRPQDVVRGQFRGYRDEPGVKGRLSDGDLCGVAA